MVLKDSWPAYITSNIYRIPYLYFDCGSIDYNYFGSKLNPHSRITFWAEWIIDKFIKHCTLSYWCVSYQDVFEDIVVI